MWPSDPQKSAQKGPLNFYAILAVIDILKQRGSLVPHKVTYVFLHITVEEPRSGGKPA